MNVERSEGAPNLYPALLTLIQLLHQQTQPNVEVLGPTVSTLHTYLVSSCLQHLLLYQQTQPHVEVVTRPHSLYEVGEEHQSPMVRNVRDSVHKGTENFRNHTIHCGGCGLGPCHASLLDRGRLYSSGLGGGGGGGGGGDQHKRE